MDHKPLAITRFALTRPVTLCMLFLSLLVFGLIASRMLPLEKFPGIDIPEIYVHVPYPNATPSETERLITRPVEEALATVTGIKKMRSFSKEDGADISLEFNWEEDINTKSIEVRERLDNMRHLLPRDVERVMVYQFNTSDMPIFQLRISSERDLAMAYDLLERVIKRPLERVPGVSKVELYGVDKRQVTIRLDPQRMRNLQVDPVQLVQLLQASNFAMTAGELRNPNESILVKPVGEFTSLDEIRALPIRAGLTLGAVADVMLELPKRIEGRHLHQTYAVGMNVFKESNANLVDVSRAAIAVVDAAGKDPAFNGINLFLMDDTAKGVTDSLSNLLGSGAMGAVLSFGVLYLFLRHIPTTLVVVLSVPVSIAITLGAMYFLGYSLNVLSMMGLMLAVGMLVDNSVVVTESIFRERAADADMKRATELGVNRVSLAVLAGTATTAIVFLPNIIGQKVDVTVFLEHVAIAITIALAVSLLMALTLIPLLTTKIKQIHSSDNAAPSKVDKFYGRCLRWVMASPKAATGIAFLLLFSIAIPLSQVSGGDDNDGDSNRAFLNYNVQGNYNLAEVEQEVNRMEAYLYQHKDEYEIESVYSYYTANHAMSIIMFNDPLVKPVSEIKEAIRKGWPQLVRSQPSFGWSDNGGGMQVHLSGPSTEMLTKLAADIVPVISQIKGLEDVRSEISDGQFEMQIQLNNEELQRQGLDASEVAQAVTLALRGTNLRTYRSDEQGELQLRVLYDEKVSHSPAELAAIPVLVKDNVVITLAQVAELKVEPLLSEIRRFNRQTTLAIGMNMNKDLTMDKAREELTQRLNQLQLPAGYAWSFEGSFQYQDEAQGIMQINMLLAVAMIYLVMAALFESLIMPTAVIGSLLFSFVGVFWAFLFTGTSMGIMGMIGMLVLMGIVVNNGIVLVDRINQLRNESPDAELVPLIIEACEARLRPILMTVSTTVLGLLPLAFGDATIGGDGPSYAPMAIAIIGGLVFSTLTSLLLVPLTYWGLVRFNIRWSGFLGKAKVLANRVITAP
ncbi:efflux RND transporter permease subunit [Rheinheimera tangshanensis]|uniref:Efflux RND transporter permease subunit n=2 Tax=Rheinheimera TaxID=67575 RepID=A0A5C8LWS4_9GAMM|nr:efflux RND transporter permease subunit [Rheinheimera tangshanensis]TXK81741.1 efflux RND transporter permease subunit [Rheinheimera tangshanensis]GGM55541.1 acriflavin resistance protein [Rheinheimera tangshanensis]